MIADWSLNHVCLCIYIYILLCIWTILHHIANIILYSCIIINTIVNYVFTLCMYIYILCYLYLRTFTRIHGQNMSKPSFRCSWMSNVAPQASKDFVSSLAADLLHTSDVSRDWKRITWDNQPIEWDDWGVFTMMWGHVPKLVPARETTHLWGLCDSSQSLAVDAPGDQTNTGPFDIWSHGLAAEMSLRSPSS